MSANDALLLIGHGSTRYPEAGNILRRQVDLLRANKLFAHIGMGLLNGSPSVSDALSAVRSPTIRVVPFFMEDGYFSRVAVPRTIVLAEADRADDPGTPPRITMCPPVGVHDGMAGIIERQALSACAALGVPSHQAAVIVIGHGSANAPGQALALHRHAARVASTTLFARVEAACLEEAPFVADTLAALRSHPVVVIGFFANQGGHMRDDVPGLIAAEEAAAPRRVRFQGSVSDDPAMAEVVLDQARQGRSPMGVRLGVV